MGTYQNHDHFSHFWSTWTNEPRVGNCMESPLSSSEVIHHVTSVVPVIFGLLMALPFLWIRIPKNWWCGCRCLGQWRIWMGIYNVIKCSLTGNCHIPLSELDRKKRHAWQRVLKRNFLLLQTHIKGWKWQWWLFQTLAGTCGYPSLSLPVREVMLLHVILWLQLALYTYIYNSSPTSLAYKIHSSIQYKLWIFPFLFIIAISQHSQHSDSRISAVPSYHRWLNWMWHIFLKVLTVRSSCHLQDSFTFWLPSRRVIGIGSFSWLTTFCLCCVVIVESRMICSNCDVCYF